MQSFAKAGGGLYGSASVRTGSRDLPAALAKPPSDLLQLTAAALSALHGDAAMLCYGGDAQASDLRQAQQCLLAVVSEWARRGLPRAAMVLVSGASLGELRRQLQQAGASVTSTLSEQPPPASCDLAVIEGSIRYPDQLGLLTRMHQLLRQQGRLLLLTENLADDSKIARSELATLSSLHQLAERLGFALLQQRDFSAAARASLDLLQQQLPPLQPQLRATLGWSEARMAQVTAEIGTITEEFASGRRCFRLFAFQKLPTAPGDPGQPVFGDIDSFVPAEIRSLFQASFGEKFDNELWAWKYQLGKGSCVVARQQQDGAILAHYGGVPRRIDYFGRPAMAIQPCDVMVSPQVRRYYGRNSLFFKTAATFLEREIGNTVRQLLGFGFPNQKAMDIAVRLGLYQKTDDFMEVVFADTDRSQQDYRFEEMDIGRPQHRQAVDSLWQAMRSEFREGIIGVRDADYIHYRYFQHPFAQRGLFERYLILDSADQVLAFVACKQHQQQRLLLDIVCPLAPMRDLLAVANQHCRQHHGQPMKLWITRGWLKQVRLAGCTVNELGIEIPCNSWNPGPDAKLLRGAWWLTAGDMDFM